VEEMEVSVTETPTGVQFMAIGVLSREIEVVLCDRTFYDWCRQPSQARVLDQARAILDRLGKTAGLPRPTDSQQSFSFPHVQRGIPLSTADPAIDGRYLWLTASDVALSSPLLDALSSLPSPVEIGAIKRDVVVLFPVAVISDELLRLFVKVVSEMSRARSGLG